MTSSNFDELTKALVNSTSRRQTLKVLFASALGSILGFGGMGIPQAEGWSGVGTSPSDVCGTHTHCAIWTDIQARVKDCKANPMHCDGIDTKKYQWIVEPYEKGRTNYTLFAADQRISGIECYKIWETGAPNYWEFAWNAARSYLPSRVREGRVGLAINSKATRTECQLHIHMSCIQANVRSQLNTYYAHGQIALDPMSWKTHVQPLKYTVNGSTEIHNFRLLYLKSLDQNLFQLLRDDVVGNDVDMQYQTLIVIEGPNDGFYILNSMDHDRDPSFNGTGFGEGLLNEMCS